MKTPPVEGWKPTRTTYPVAIPTLDGKAVARTVNVDVDAWENAEGEIFLDGDAQEKLEAVKAREMGLLTPGEIKEIRVSKLKATQKAISQWLQIGEKTWTRWESGRERPSRSMNVLLCALRDGKIDAHYLDGLRFGRQISRLFEGDNPPIRNRVTHYRTGRRLEDLSLLPKTGPTILCHDFSALAHWAAAVQTQHPHETPWSAVAEQRSVATRQVFDEMENTLSATLAKRSGDLREVIRTYLDEAFQG